MKQTRALGVDDQKLKKVQGLQSNKLKLQAEAAEQQRYVQEHGHGWSSLYTWSSTTRSHKTVWLQTVSVLLGVRVFAH